MKFSAYFLPSGHGAAHEEYFEAKDHDDAVGQARAFAERHGVRYSSTWRLVDVSPAGRSVVDSEAQGRLDKRGFSKLTRGKHGGY